MTEDDVAFHQQLGHLLEHVQSDQFWPALAAFLREQISFTSWVVLVFRKSHPPLLVHEGDTDYIEDVLFGRYLRQFYLDDPFYRIAMASPSEGVHRLDEVAYPQFRVSAYFHDYFQHNVGADEIQLLTAFKDAGQAHGVLSLSLGAQRRFSSRAYGRLVMMCPWILPLLRLATKAMMVETWMPADEITRAGLEKRLGACEGGRLTEREMQTVVLLLQGQSTKGIAAHLGISPETVKVHRRNLYEKLGVSTQAELFARYSQPG